MRVPPQCEVHPLGASLTAIICARYRLVVDMIEGDLHRIAREAMIARQRGECCAPAVERHSPGEPERLAIDLLNRLTADVVTAGVAGEYVPYPTDPMLPSA